MGRIKVKKPRRQRRPWLCAECGVERPLAGAIVFDLNENGLVTPGHLCTFCASRVEIPPGVKPIDVDETLRKIKERKGS